MKSTTLAHYQPKNDGKSETYYTSGGNAAMLRDPFKIDRHLQHTTDYYPDTGPKLELPTGAEAYFGASDVPALAHR